MIKIYDKRKNKLAFFKQEANNVFWDNHWKSNDYKGEVICKKNSLVQYLLNKYACVKSAKMIEAGCGRGRIVYYIHHCGYKNIYGVDNAEKTVATTNRIFPDLKVSVQDISKTDFSDGFFNIYFSFGVIEHYYNGYDIIIREAERILAHGGFAIISFPYMSPLRKFKAKFGLYQSGSLSSENFYQFALCKEEVIEKLKNLNLFLVESIKYDGIKGLKDEIKLLEPALKKLYNYKGRSIFIKALRYIADIIFRIFASHMMLLVFKKNE